VQREVERGYDVIVIVSAMSGKTNELVGWVESTSKLYDAREYDAVVASGENVTAGLMALRLQEMGVPARSWQGWQVPINTTSAHGSARFVSIPRENIDAKFAEGFKVAVVAGFPGRLAEGRITTLGRGGIDTTAVAFAAAFGAERCDIYTDVDGVYTTDPRISPRRASWTRSPSRRCWNWPRWAPRCCRPARSNWPCATRCAARAVVLSRTPTNSGTLVCDEEEIMESKVVSGVAFSREEAKMTLSPSRTAPASPQAIFGPLAEAGVNVDMIVQNISEKDYDERQAAPSPT
jgi:aspartate kinase